jgi:hypothetical protein
MISTIMRIARTGRGGRRSPSRPSSTGDFAFHAGAKALRGPQPESQPGKTSATLVVRQHRNSTRVSGHLAPNFRLPARARRGYEITSALTRPLPVKSNVEKSTTGTTTFKNTRHGARRCIRCFARMCHDWVMSLRDATKRNRLQSRAAWLARKLPAYAGKRVSFRLCRASTTPRRGRAFPHRALHLERGEPLWSLPAADTLQRPRGASLDKSSFTFFPDRFSGDSLRRSLSVSQDC